MAAISTIIAAVGAAAAVGGAGYSVYSGEKQRESVDNEKGRAAARADEQKKAAEKLKADALAKENAIRTRDEQAARARLSGMRGRSSTILTSPSGTTDAPPAGGKTLLGA